MKKVVALRNYSNRYIVIREGMIYNLDDSIADSLIEKGVLGLGIPDDISVTPSSTTGTQIADIKVNGQSNKIYAPAGGAGNMFTINFDWDSDQDKYISNKTFTEVITAYSSAIPILAFMSNTLLAFKVMGSSTNGQDIDKMKFYFWQDYYDNPNNNVFSFYTLEMTVDGINDGFSYQYELPLSSNS